ncbi:MULTISPECIES: UDP-N-acetylglucosamine--N-acetylmuramyl-(pentapeptide) pyrophosphoryl-undecaprenol N-acetylglucosamine transferase [Methanobacterium]|uniref:Glycosyl transferase n=1 Tax=Methanobacterium bryantii TaxID=2161 RepID=A0A2A2H4J8_METBR|nr:MULTISPECIES: UDP-N-acetylglucosamine--N-acetylmuramyl-(pentapeptide) pyrophosphoryl-undecaprenol N-acetylglucosamine transferase [Methanobacterium]OEC84694.1 glycosyl transferase [Methanobacterium sp. A39]PAV04287.1 glycosyl transferase [Methanobacterium bryantii]
MKVLFMTCGIGMGHVSRDIALAKRLEEKNVDVNFASYGPGYEMLSKQGKYKIFKLPDIQLYGGNGELDIKYTAKKSINIPFIFIKNIYHEFKIIKELKPDIVIGDSHYSAPITCRILKIPCILITNELTLNFAELYPDRKIIEYAENGLKRFIESVSNQCDAIIIPDIENSIEIPPKLRGITTFTGPFLKRNPSQIEDKNELRKKLRFHENDKIVLVTVGGSKFGKKLLNLIIDSAKWIDCNKIIIVTGPQISFDFIQDSDKIVKKEFLEDIMEWMKLSDVVISLAGHNTTMELASLGIPNILVPIDNHSEQIKNALNMKKYGISAVKNINELNPQEFADDINNILHDDDDLKQKAEIVKKEFSKYDGKENAAKIILKYAKQNDA